MSLTLDHFNMWLKIVTHKQTQKVYERLEKTLNFLGIEPWLPVREADALTAGQTMLTHVFYFLFRLISYVNYSNGTYP